MSRYASRQALLLGTTLLLMFGFSAQVSAQSGFVPNFQSGSAGWQHRFGSEFPAVQGSALPVMNDPGHPYINNELARINNMQPNYRISDVSNPNLKQWAKDAMKKDNDEVLAGKIAYTPGQACEPQGVPAFTLAQGPLIFLQTPSEVVMVEESSQEVRHIYLNVPHSKNVKPSWFGESVGRYEGDTLVVDTVGLNTKTFIDPFRTPHTEKLHVVERWRIIGGDTLEVRITINDPDTFYQPWQTYQLYRRAQRPLAEDICQEGNLTLFDYGVPVAKKPDF